MKNVLSSQDIIAKTTKRLLKRLEKEPVDICPGYSYLKHVSVSFMVFGKNQETPMFEISLGTRGRIIYKNNQKYVNPPYFDEVFDMVYALQKQKIAEIKDKKPYSSDIQIDKAQTIILNLFKEHHIIKR